MTKDIYLEQAYVSMWSLKYHNPTDHIIVLMDTKTKETLSGHREAEIKWAEETIVIDFKENKYTNVQRSRILKTSARRYVTGDFLFVDTDTIITKSLESIDNVSADMAACRDSHSPFKENPYRRMCIEHGKTLGWPIEEEDTYFNSGVIFVKESDLAKRFYERRNANWVDGFHKRFNMDQPAFAKTNYEMGQIVKELDGAWNCELRHGVQYLKDALIVHYLCTNIS